MTDTRKGVNSLKKHTPPTDISGFVCPNCMMQFEESSNLMDHFTTQHAETEPIEKVSAFRTFISSIVSDGISHQILDPQPKPPQLNEATARAVLDEEKSKLLESMKEHNAVLLQRLSEEHMKIMEFEAVARFIFDGVPLPADFKFRTATLECQVRRYLDTSVDQASLKSIVEAKPGETLCRADELQHDQSAIDVLSTQLTAVKKQLTDLKRQRCTEVAALSKELEAVKADLVAAVRSTNDSPTQSTASSAELERLKSTVSSHQETESRLRTELGDLQRRWKALEQKAALVEKAKAALAVKCSTFEENQARVSAELVSLRSERDELDAKCTQLVRQHAEVLKSASDLETKLSQAGEEAGAKVDRLTAQLQTAKQEVDSLMSRLIKSEDQSKALEETVKERDSQLEKLRKVVYELGRENQTLQILRERVSSRQWANDNEVTTCQDCSKEFSLSSRKHHCRVCGGIFCQNCSSHRASTPACKDPVRVCNTCFVEVSKPA